MGKTIKDKHLSSEEKFERVKSRATKPKFEKNERRDIKKSLKDYER